MRWTPWFAGLAATAVLSCSSSSEPSGNGGNGGGTITPDATVSVQNNFFDPSTTNIAVNQTVRWSWNSGGTQHNVTFDIGPNSPTQGSGQFDRTFDAAGTFNYHCTIHGLIMSGSVVVGQSPGGPGSGTGGGGGGPMGPGY